MAEDTSQNAGGGAPSGGDGGGSSTPARPTSASAAISSAVARSATPPASAKPGVKPTGQPGAGAGSPAGSAAPQQPGSPAPGQPETRTGYVPTSEHEKAVKNARQKAMDEVTQKYAWANGLDPEDVKAAIARWSRLKQDPRKFSADLIAELEGLNDALPEPDVRSKDGVLLYSQQTMAKIVAQIRNEMRRTAQEAVKPFVDERTEREQKAAQEQKIEEARQEGRKAIKQALTHARTLPHFTENEKAISAKLDQITPQTRNQVGLVAAMYMAYSAVLADIVNSAREEGGRQTLDDMKRRAFAGSGNASPGGPRATTPASRPKNERELASHMERLAEKMAATS